MCIRDSFVFQVFSPQASYFKSLASSYGICDIVSCQNTLGLYDFRDAIKSADCFLLLESLFTEDHGVMTAKVYDYLYVGKPILLSGVSTNAELHRFISKNGVALDLSAFIKLFNHRNCQSSIKITPFDQGIKSREALVTLFS